MADLLRLTEASAEKVPGYGFRGFEGLLKWVCGAVGCFVGSEVLARFDHGLMEIRKVLTRFYGV